MTKFLLDQNVNRKAVRAVPVASKGFEVAFSVSTGLARRLDSTVLRHAEINGQVVVTNDKDFERLRVQPSNVSFGVIVLRPKSQPRVGDLLSKLCKFLISTRPEAPYDFRKQVLVVSDDGIEVSNVEGTAFYNWD